jgi:hypothetical protein
MIPQTLLRACLVALLFLGATEQVCSTSKTFQEPQEEASGVDCPLQCTSPGLRQTRRTRGARIFYLIIVHNRQSMEEALFLFRAIRDPRNIVAIHVDVKARDLLLLSSSSDDRPTNALLREIQDCPCGSQVRVDAVHNVQWSQWSMNLPTFWGLELAVQEYANQWDVFVNLAGNTLPVYTPHSMATILHDLPYNFVTSSSCETGLLPTNVYHFPSYWHKRQHYTRNDSEPDPILVYTDEHGVEQQQTVQIYFGSQWVILQADYCVWLVKELQREDSLPSRLAETLQASGKRMTDETFLSTLLMHSERFSSTLPVTNDNGDLLWRNGTASAIRAVRYERMDEHVPTAFGNFWKQQRYEVPETSKVEKPRVWGPYYLGVYDLANIRQSGALFVRKISTSIDPNLLQLLPVDDASEIPPIQWPEEILLSEKPDWDKRLSEMHKKAKESDLPPESSEGDEDEEL